MSRQLAFRHKQSRKPGNMSRSLRILILEDTPEDAELAISALEAGGFSCAWERVQTKDEFVDKLENGTFDLVISDYSLPSFNGLSAARIFAEAERDIPFILVSGTLGEEAAIESLKAGANDFVLKTKLFRLPHAVERALKEKADYLRARRSESQVRLQAVALESAANAIVVTDPAGSVTYVNPAFETLTGYTREEITGLNLRILKSSEHPDDFYKEMWETIAAGDVWRGELVNRHKSGRYYIEEQTVTPVKDVRGRIVNYIAVKQDITERNRVETENSLLAAQIAAEKERLNTIIDKVPGMVWETWFDPSQVDNRVNFVSTYVERMLGYTVDEWLSEQDFWLKVVHPDDEARVRNEVEQYLLTGLSGPVEHRFMAKDGRVIWVETHTAAITDVNDSPIGIRGVTIDISDRKRGEQERHVISEIIDASLTSKTLEHFLELTHKAIATRIYSQNFFVMLHDPKTDEIEFEFWVDKYDEKPAPRPLGNDFCGYVLRTGEPLLLDEELTNRMIANGDAIHSGSPSPSWVGLPLRTPQRTVGVMVLQHYEMDGAFGQQDLEFLAAVAEQIAMAIERKEAENALAESAERYRLLFSKNPLPMWVYDTATLEFLATNDAAVRQYGYTEDEFLSMTLADIRPPEDLPKLHDSVRSHTSGLRIGQMWRHLKKNGTVIDVEVASHALTFAGRPARIVLAKDITESKLAAVALRSSEERYRELVENAIDIIYTHDLSGRFLSVNRVAEQVTGYTTAEILKMNLENTVAPEYLEKAHLMIEANVRGENVPAFDLEIIAKDGSRIPVEVNTRLLMADGKPVGIQGIARNIIDRKTLEEQLRQAQKMEAVGLLAGGVAHDFNNLLTAISGYSDLTLLKMNREDPLREYVMEVKSAGERAAGLTTQLLAFSRKQVLMPRVHNLNTVIKEIEKMLRRIIRESVDLKVVLDPDLANIKADPGQIEQVIMNLAVNARDAMPEGGTLTIETQNIYLDADYVTQHIDVQPGPFVRLTVTDTGHGMDEATKKSAFVPFFTTKAVGSGTGLGLSTVHGIVKQSGGDIIIYSEPGHGTSFKLYFPCVTESVQIPRWHEDGPSNYVGTETILLVEDDEIVRNLVRTVLHDLGYEVLEAENGSEALSVCKRFAAKIDLVLTDLIMPVMGGTELKKELVKIIPDVKMLFMSGYTDEAISESGLLTEGSAFIEKPFSPERLSRKIRQILSN